MTSGPRVTVVVPTWNRAAVIEACVASVRAQTDPDWELLVVDDGGTDDTPARLAAILAADARMRLLRIAHSGPAAARNAGIREARGEFLAFLDSDDHWEPERLRVGLAALEADPALLAVVTGYRFEDAQGAPAPAPEPPVPGKGDRLADLFRHQFFWLPCVLARTEAVRAAGLLDESLPAAEDLDLGLRLASRGPIAVLPDVLTVIRRDGASLTADPVSTAERYGVLRRYADRVPPAVARARLHAVAAATGDVLLAAGRPLAALPFLLRAIRHGPGDSVPWKNVARATRDLVLGGGEGPRVGSVLLRMGSVRAIGLAVALARAKVVALALGQAGLGVLSQVTQFGNLLTAVAFLGFGRGLVREASRRTAPGGAASAGDLRVTVRVALLVSGAVIPLAAAVFSPALSSLLLGTPEHAWLIALAALAVPCTLAANYFGALLSAHQDLPGQTLAQAGGLWCAALPIMVLAPLAGLSGAGAALPLSGAIAALVTALAWRRSPGRGAWGAAVGRFDPGLLRLLLAFGAVGALATLAEHASMNAVRRLVIDAGGEPANGRYQAALGLSRTLLPLLLATLSLETFPRLSAAAPPSLPAELRRTLRAAMAICFPAALLLALFPGFWLRVLYAEEFRSAAPLLRWQVLADWLDVAAWAALCGWTASGRLGRVLAVSVLACGLHAAAAAWAIPVLREAGAPAAHALARVGELIAIATLERRLPLPDGRALIVFAGAAALFAALAVIA